MITAFPKIFTIGQDYIGKIFDGPVEVTEKIDGSQFAFGVIDNELQIRSKGRIIHDYAQVTESDLFYPAIQHVMSIIDELPNNMVFYGETLKKPKHNTLAYERVPRNHIALFGIADPNTRVFVSDHDGLSWWANKLNVDVVPLLYHGYIDSAEFIKQFMDKPSMLGGTNAEGVVVKNYAQSFLLGGQPIPFMAGKYVTEAFKEVHRKNWSKENTGPGKWQMFKESFKTEARWEKAVQHLRDNGELENSPKDIGKLIKAIRDDITEEEKETIKDFLWQQYGQDLLRYACGGFPEWYKMRLLEGAFDD